MRASRPVSMVRGWRRLTDEPVVRSVAAALMGCSSISSVGVVADGEIADGVE